MKREPTLFNFSYTKVGHSTRAVAEEEENDESYDTDVEGITDTVSDRGRTASSESPGTSSTSAASVTAVTDCSAHCCDPQRNSPHQPTKLTGTRQVQGSGKSKQMQVGWFKQYPWLSLCETRQRLFCFYCQFAERRKLVKFSTKGEDTFSKTGFCNWKKAGERFCKHEGSQVHAESCMKIKKVVDVSIVLAECNRVQQEIRCKMLLKQLTSLKYLLRQGLTIRGHTEGEGNLLQLLLLRAEDNQDLFAWVRDNKYLSPDIFNEEIRLMADFVLCALLSDVRSSTWFSILADEATDVKFNEQMCVAIR